MIDRSIGRRVEHNDADITIGLVGDRKRGIWGCSVSPRIRRSTRYAGQIGAHASRHTLLSAGLIAALRSISRKTIEILQREPGAKVRVFVTTLDTEFAEAASSLLKTIHAEGTKRLRAGRNFRDELRKQLRRFEVTIVAEPDHAELLSLGNWASNSVLNERYLSFVPSAFRPLTASQLD